MSCSRGKAAPDPHTKLKLFADSGGYCQNPDCNINLFLNIGNSDFHIAEMAHVISAGDKGPRANKKLSKQERGNFDNLLLLCPTCHTKIDKAESEFPDSLILKWKREHAVRIKTVFDIKQFYSRIEARKSILPILNQNKTIFDTYGPLGDSRHNPESEIPMIWKSKIHQIILPNNRKLLSLFDANYNLLNTEEVRNVELFRQHVLDFESRHINNLEVAAIQFPTKLPLTFID